MKKRNILILFISNVFLVTLAGVLNAQSLFGSYGFGEMRYFIHARSVSMGGSGLAIKDPIIQNHLNPSLMVDVANTSFGAGFRYEGLRFERTSGSSTGQNAVINDFSFTIKANNQIAFGGGLHPYADTDYTIVTASNGYINTVESSGGITMGYMGIAYRINRKIALGLNYVLLFGKANELWMLDFQNEEYSNTKSEYIQSKWGSGVSVGASVSVLPQLMLGGVFISEFSIKTTDRIRYYSGKNATREGETTTIPYSFGLGTAFSPLNGLTVAADIFQWQTGELSTGRMMNEDYRNSARYSAGIEYDAEDDFSSSLSRKLIYRAGFYYWDLYSRDIDSSPLSEKFITVGFGLPVFSNQARLDVAFEGGLRSSKTETIGSEKIFRIHINFGGGERWFIR